jgi:hypothetical protein
MAPREVMRQKVQEAYERACKEDDKQYAPPGYIPIYTSDQVYYMMTGRVRMFHTSGLGLSWITEQDDGTWLYTGMVRQDGKVSHLSNGTRIPFGHKPGEMLGQRPVAIVKDGFLEGRTWQPEYDYPCRSPYMAIVEYK